MGRIIFRNRLDTDVPSLVTWTQQSVTDPWPAFNGWLQNYYDPISQRMIVFTQIDGASGIYGTNLFAYNAGTNGWTDMGGTDQLESIPCYANVTTGTQWPGNRHPYAQNALDLTRNVLWQWSGVCNGVLRLDLWKLHLNADPTTDTWEHVPVTTLPNTDAGGCMVHFPVEDVLFLFGTDTGAQTHTNWVYGPTDLNPSPGTLTAAQIAAGCAVADDWTEVSVVGGVQPPAVVGAGMVHFSSINRAVLYGGESGNGTVKYNQTWWYEVAAKTWTQKALSTTAPTLYTGSLSAYPAIARYPASDGLFFHATHGSGTPSDWLYKPATDTWHALSSSGGGPTSRESVLVWDAANSRFVSWSLHESGRPDVWHGVPS
jgi:hypothetical protein